MGRFRAQPYAKALLTVVQKEGPQRMEGVAAELDRVVEALDAVPEFERVLVTPMVSVETKSEILDEVLDSLEIGQPTRRFFHVVQQHYRMVHMKDIAIAFREFVDQRLGRSRARIETVVDLEENPFAGIPQFDCGHMISAFVGFGYECHEIVIVVHARFLSDSWLLAP